MPFLFEMNRPLLLWGFRGFFLLGCSLWSSHLDHCGDHLLPFLLGLDGNLHILLQVSKGYILFCLLDLCLIVGSEGQGLLLLLHLALNDS